MDNTELILQSHEERLRSLEESSRKHEGLISAAEDKASSAWKTIVKVQEDVGDIFDKMEEMDNNVKTVMVNQASTDKRMDNMETKMNGIYEDSVVAKSNRKLGLLLLKILLGGVGVVLLINIAMLIYLWTHNPELAKEIVSFGKTAVEAIP